MKIPSLEEFIKSQIDIVAKSEPDTTNAHGQISAYQRVLNYIEYVRSEGE